MLKNATEQYHQVERDLYELENNILRYRNLKNNQAHFTSAQNLLKDLHTINMKIWENQLTTEQEETKQDGTN